MGYRLTLAHGGVNTTVSQKVEILGWPVDLSRPEHK